jgi:3-dehydroquinate synthase
MPTARVRVSLRRESEDRSYDILIRRGALEELGAGRISLPPGGSYFIVTDSNVARLHGRRLKGALCKQHPGVGLASFPAGEASKSLETASNVASRLSELGVDRGSVILALGGGVVGDLAGFVASVYKRGIRYVQLPTTLLAMVDSSIGGKTGVDTPWGKNQLGTFHQPELVVADPDVLKTLPPQEMNNGLAEIVKYAIIADPAMFDRLRALTIFDAETLSGFIVDACRIKARVVSKDEREANLRAVLNFGHTVGHAIESSSDYKLAHGACVFLGMMAESWIAHRLGLLPESDFNEITELLRRLSGASARPGSLNPVRLAAFARADKKAMSSTLRMSLPSKVGLMHSTGGGSYLVPVLQETFRDSIEYLKDVLSRRRPQTALMSPGGPQEKE